MIDPHEHNIGEATKTVVSKVGPLYFLPHGVVMVVS